MLLHFALYINKLLWLLPVEWTLGCLINVHVRCWAMAYDHIPFSLWPAIHAESKNKMQELWSSLLKSVWPTFLHYRFRNVYCTYVASSCMHMLTPAPLHTSDRWVPNSTAVPWHFGTSCIIFIQLFFFLLCSVPQVLPLASRQDIFAMYRFSLQACSKPRSHAIWHVSFLCLFSGFALCVKRLSSMRYPSALNHICRWDFS